MPSLLSKILLFLSGYLPLFIIMTFKYYKVIGIISIIPIIIGIIATLWIPVFFWYTKKIAPHRIVVETVQRKDSEVIAYIFTYVLPFLNPDIKDLWNLFGLLIFFIVLLILYVNSNMIHINPTLNIFGFHIYEISTDEKIVQSILTRKNRLIRGTNLNVVTVGDDILVEQ